MYAVAEKAVWIRGDETCEGLVMIACQIALASQHVNVAAFLCHEWLKATGMAANTKKYFKGSRLCCDTLECN